MDLLSTATEGTEGLLVAPPGGAEPAAVPATGAGDAGDDADDVGGLSGVALGVVDVPAVPPALLIAPDALPAPPELVETLDTVLELDPLPEVLQPPSVAATMSTAAFRIDRGQIARRAQLSEISDDMDKFETIPNSVEEDDESFAALGAKIRADT